MMLRSREGLRGGGGGARSGWRALGLSAFRWTAFGGSALVLVATAVGASAGGCLGGTDEDCAVTNSCGTPAGSGGSASGGAGSGASSAGGSASGGSASGGSGGNGGAGGGNETCVEDPEICEGMAPICNPVSMSCEQCRYHAQCPESACNPFTGACLEATPETVGSGGTYADLNAALASVGDGEEAVFLLSEGDFLGPPTLTGDKVVALLAGEAVRPVLFQGNLSTLNVGADATLLVEGVDVRASTGAPLVMANGKVALDRVHVVASGMGEAVRTGAGAEVLARNSILAQTSSASNLAAIHLGAGGTLRLLYGTVMSATFPGIVCGGRHDVSLRNSIVFAVGQPTFTSCDPLTAAYTTSDEDLGPTNYETLLATSYFEDRAAGELRLSSVGQGQLSDRARWEAGDPPTDIDGVARPSTDGADDLPGASLGP